VAADARRRVPASAATETLREAIGRRPVSVGGAPLTLHSVTQVAVAPPTFAVRVNRPDEVHFSYARYLAKSLRRAFGFAGSPIRLSLRKGASRRSRPRKVSR
jgi:GTP-binding protein